MGNICGVKFKDSGKIYYFKADGFDLKKCNCSCRY